MASWIIGIITLALGAATTVGVHQQAPLDTVRLHSPIVQAQVESPKQKPVALSRYQAQSRSVHQRVFSSNSDIPKGYKIIEGDILVPLDFEKLPEAAYGMTPWPEGIVYYEFDDNVSESNRNAMIAAMQEWMDEAGGVSFVPWSGEPNWVHIQDSDVNNSMVGMISGMQIINIYNWDYTYIMAHELAHTLGFWHEQSRPDRDTACDGDPCVVIEEENIEPGFENNFALQSGASTVGPYDYDSVMHYGACDFSMCGDCSADDAACRTITVPPPNEAWQDQIGQRDHLSTNDINGMQERYGTAATVYVDFWSAPTGNGTLADPYPSFSAAMGEAPQGAKMFLRGGTYYESGTYANNVTLRPYQGTVRIGWE